MEKVRLRGHLFGQGTRVRVSEKNEKTLVFPLPLGSQGALRQNMGEEVRERRGKGRKQKRRKERREFLEGVGCVFSSRHCESPRERSHSYLTVPQGHPPANKHSYTQKVQSCLKKLLY